MKIRNLVKFSVCFLCCQQLFVSCSPKDGNGGSAVGVVQASTRATGSTNSNERFNLSPYPTGKKNAGKSGEDKPESNETAEEEKKDPPVYPISGFVTAERNAASASPADPSVPGTPAVVNPPLVSGAQDGVLSSPPEIQSKPEPVPETVPEEAAEEKKEEISEEPETTPTEEKTPEEPEPAVEAALQDEYVRSLGDVSNTSVTREVFEEDKKAVLRIIDELSSVIQSKDYKAWRSYLDDDSIKYWSTKKNLQKAQKRLPIKGIYLNTLEDYFKYVFIPSRIGRNVDEIRYETEKQVKAVHVNGENDTVYYYFKKSANGVWKLHLPPISD